MGRITTAKFRQDEVGNILLVHYEDDRGNAYDVYPLTFSRARLGKHDAPGSYSDTW